MEFPSDLQNTQLAPSLPEFSQLYDSLDHSITSICNSFNDFQIPPSIVSQIIIQTKQIFSEYHTQTKETFDFLQNKCDNLTNEIASYQEENDQLNEMSLNLLSQIGKLKKYLNDSDVLISLLRAEVSQFKHDKKIALQALQESSNGNTEVALRVLHDFQNIVPKKAYMNTARKSCILLPLMKKSNQVDENISNENTENEPTSPNVMGSHSLIFPKKNFTLDLPFIKSTKSLNSINSPRSRSGSFTKRDIYNPQNSTLTEFEDNKTLSKIALEDDKDESFVIFNEDFQDEISQRKSSIQAEIMNSEKQFFMKRERTSQKSFLNYQESTKSQKSLQKTVISVETQTENAKVVPNEIEEKYNNQKEEFQQTIKLINKLKWRVIFIGFLFLFLKYMLKRGKLPMSLSLLLKKCQFQLL